MGSSCGGALKTFFGTILFVCFIGFLLVVMNVSSAMGITTTKSSTGNLKQLEVKGRDTPVVHSNLDPNYMSKRRVPNGPDPIHNRRAGKSRQPPGRA